MNRPYLILLLMLAFVTVFFVGARFGANAFIQADAKYRALLTVTKLQAIDDGNIDYVKESLYFDVDSALLSHMDGSKNPLIYLWPELKPGDEGPVKNVARYVFSHPYSRKIDDLSSSIGQDELLQIQNDQKLIQEFVIKHRQ